VERAVENAPLRPVLFAGLLLSAALVACESKVVSPTGTRVSARDEAAATQKTAGTPEDEAEDLFSVKPDPAGLGTVAAGVQLPVRRDSDFCYYDNAGYCLSQTGNPPVWDYSSKNGYYMPCSTGSRAGRCKEGTFLSCFCNTP
jgi:hypothetical protein